MLYLMHGSAHAENMSLMSDSRVKIVTTTTIYRILIIQCGLD